MLLVINQFFFYLNDPFLPFLPFLDVFNDVPGVLKITQRFLFVVAGILLWFNYRVRLMAIILGLVVVFALLGSKPMFRNHLFIVGCIFLLSGLSNKNTKPWLLFWQLSLVYFGAFINKVVQIDWWDGQFMHNWLVNARQNIPYISVSQLLPDMLLAKLISWLSMALEFSIAVMLLFRKTHFRAFWLIVLFHGLMYTMVLFRFGHFMEDILLMLLIFLNWPKQYILAHYREDGLHLLIRFLKLLNFNRQINYQVKQLGHGAWLRTEINEVPLSNWSAYSFESTPIKLMAMLAKKGASGRLKAISTV